MLPTVQIKDSFLYSGTDYLTTSDIYDYSSGTYKRYYMRKGELHDTQITMTMTRVDYELFLQHYDVYDLQVLDGCWFRTEIGLFDEYMYKYKKIKESSQGAERELAKLYLNNLYGKFSANDSSSYKVPYINKKNVLGFELVEEHEKKPGYIAIGSAITSYARRFVINAAQANFHGVENDGFIYCDTDSIHCSGDPEDCKGIKFIRPISVRGNWKAIGTMLYLYGKRRILSISPTKTELGLINPITAYVVLECQRTLSKNLSKNTQSRSLEKD